MKNYWLEDNTKSVSIQYQPKFFTVKFVERLKKLHLEILKRKKNEKLLGK